MLENFKNWKTTVLGIAMAVVTILVVMGYIDPDKVDLINLNIETVVTALGTIVGGFVSLWLMFKSKDK